VLGKAKVDLDLLRTKYFAEGENTTLSDTLVQVTEVMKQLTEKVLQGQFALTFQGSAAGGNVLQLSEKYNISDKEEVNNWLTESGLSEVIDGDSWPRIFLNQGKVMMDDTPISLNNNPAWSTFEKKDIGILQMRELWKKLVDHFGGKHLKMERKQIESMASRLLMGAAMDFDFSKTTQTLTVLAGSDITLQNLENPSYVFSWDENNQQVQCLCQIQFKEFFLTGDQAGQTDRTCTVTETITPVAGDEFRWTTRINTMGLKHIEFKREQLPDDTLGLIKKEFRSWMEQNLPGEASSVCSVFEGGIKDVRDSTRSIRGTLLAENQKPEVEFANAFYARFKITLDALVLGERKERISQEKKDKILGAVIEIFDQSIEAKAVLVD
jgi:hypothetical protein